MSRTYLTKTEAIEFAQFTHSDERRARLQREALKKYKEGVSNFMPWTVAERFVTDDDFKAWKMKKEEGKERLEALIDFIQENKLLKQIPLSVLEKIDELNSLK